MKKTLFSLLLFLLSVPSYAQLTTCTVTATIYDWQGQPADSVEVRVTKVLNQAGKLIVARPYSYQTNASGVASIVVPRSTATDTVTAYIFIDLWNSPFASRGRLGVGVAIPNAATANLEDLDPTDVIPLTHVVAVPLLTAVDSSTASFSTDSLRFGAGLKLVRHGTGGGTPTLIAIPTHGDSIKVAYDTLTAHKTAIDTKQNVLTAAQIARIDSILGAGYRITITSAGQIQVFSVDTTGLTQGARITALESDVALRLLITALTDTLSLNITRGETVKRDTASLAALGDKLYPRTAGAAVDTTKFVSRNRNDAIYGQKLFKGEVGGLRFTNGVGNVTTWAFPDPGAYANAVNLCVDAYEADSAVHIGNSYTKRGLSVRGGGYFRGRVRASDLRANDTIRSGDYTTYSYFIPGGALVQSSTMEIKRNISDVPTPVGIFAKFLSVNPKRYQFKPEAFRSLHLSNVSDTLTKAEKTAAIRADSLKAFELAKRWQVGLIAEEFNGMLGRTGSEIDQAEVSAVLWKVLQETLRAGNALRLEVDALKAKVTDFELRIKALEARL